MIAGINPEATCLCAGCTTAERVFLGKDRIPAEQSIHLKQEAKAKTRGIRQVIPVWQERRSLAWCRNDFKHEPGHKVKAVYGEVVCFTARLEATFGPETDLTLLTAVVLN